MTRYVPFLSLCVLLALGISVLTACGETTASSGATSTTTPSPTATPGWQVYQGPHFSISYPPGWTASEQSQSNSTPQRPDVTYSFIADSGGGDVFVNEQDGWDNTSIQTDFCPNPNNDPTVTLAGLPMRYSVIEGGAYRNWLFISNMGTVYGIGAQDGGGAGQAARQAQNDAVLATFHAEYTTPGCASQ